MTMVPMLPVRVRRPLVGVMAVLLVGCTGGADPGTTTQPPAAATSSTSTIEAPATTVPDPAEATSSTTSTSAPAIDTEPIVAWSQVEGGFGGQLIQSVAATPEGFVAVGVAADGSDPRWWQSADGVAWTGAPLELPGFTAAGGPGALYAGGAGFLLTDVFDPADPWAAPEHLWLSQDGARWDLVTPGAVAVTPELAASFRLEGELVPVAVSDAGFLVAGGFRASLDVEALLADWFPDVAGTGLEWDFSGERGEQLVVLNESGNVVGLISSEDLGFPGMPFEALFEGVGGDGLWFSSDGEEWHALATGGGEAGFEGGIVGTGQPVDGVRPEIVVGCGRWFFAAENVDVERAEIRAWRSQDGLSWEEFATGSPGPVWSLACSGEGLAAATGFEGSAVWIATPEGGWEQATGTGLGLHAIPDLYGGPAGLIAAERLPQAGCVDEPCQFLPDTRLVFTSDGSTWSRVETGSGRFGMNAVVREIASGAERILALTEHPLEGIGDPALRPTRLWVGTPGTRPAGTAPPEPELGRTAEVIYPGHVSALARSPELDVLVRVYAGSRIDRVEVNGEPTPFRETDPTGATDYRTTIDLDPGPNTIDIALYGPGVEEHTSRGVTFLPDAEERYAQLTAVTPESITVDWIEVDESSEFLSFVDDDPGVLEDVPLADDVIVMVSMTAVPLRYFIDQWAGAPDGEGLRSSDWIISIHQGAVVEMLQVVWG